MMPNDQHDAIGRFAVIDAVVDFILDYDDSPISVEAVLCMERIVRHEPEAECLVRLIHHKLRTLQRKYVGGPTRTINGPSGIDGHSLSCVQGSAADPLAVLALPDCTVEIADCSICLEQDGHGNVVSSLPCGHDFHRTCIRRWLQSSTQCPECRAELPDTVGAADNVPVLSLENTWTSNQVLENRVSRWNVVSLKQKKTTGSTGLAPTVWFMDCDGDMVKRVKNRRGKKKLVRVPFDEWVNDHELAAITVRVFDDTDRFPCVSKGQFDKSYDDVATPMRVLTLFVRDGIVYKQTANVTVSAHAFSDTLFFSIFSKIL
ncbi:hypothetical protein SARC_06080 [Sphaeroforma arctica JP610]|uniref:RING-type domain-containing protein n=1 Tax=Sphaeroforma arctica JP610 TaxID=667725 RepID=A0A0L0FXR5_9EUKA|nr:hypothetical protein SARC_06080 [Sphaeroforma arctica JP610]KNC81602.1 hypothetical protein SARC_06080 [Sphaeroforma arctica JP610]|eukprot:XP_014155504.1 hypothetical protein SARC_06080 [Sphaeroforma arctica JP610]